MENKNWSIEPTLTDIETWFVYPKDDVEELIKCMNERGEREKDLKSKLEKSFRLDNKTFALECLFK